jgi:hypothetical protein
VGARSNHAASVDSRAFTTQWRTVKGNTSSYVADKRRLREAGAAEAKVPNKIRNRRSLV